MRAPPPPHLIALLERLGLAAEAEVRQMGRRVGRLARDLPRFESVWVDALAQARILTPFQAAEINAGRGESLRVGPYVLCGSLRWPDYLSSYRARRLDSREVVRLAVVETAGKRSDEILRRLAALVAASKKVQSEQLAPVTEVGADGDRIWAASRWIEGRAAAEWMAHNGRFPPEVVLEIARAMLAGLVALEKTGLCHGDVSTAGLILTDAGGVVLLEPGIRAILRPEEGYAHADLRPEAYDYLAPERITAGTPPTITSDVYACGCVWWHLLCGRPPLSGGNSLAKLRAAQEAKVFDVRRLAPEVPGPLAAALSACLQVEASRRPGSMARPVAMLGPPSRCGKLALARCLARPRRPAARGALSVRVNRRSSRVPLRLAATAGCLAAAVAIPWLIWQAGAPGPRGHRQRAEQKVPHHSPARKGDVPGGGETSGRPRSAGRGHPDTPSDNPVVAASYEAGQSPSKAPPLVPQDLVLATGGPLQIESLRLQAGQCVRGEPGERPLVMVPRTGLVVEAENVRFENIDFVWSHPAMPRGPIASRAAIVDLRSARATFCCCSFGSDGTPSAPPVAIRWSHPTDPSDSVLSLPSGRVRLSDCLLRGVDVGVDCRTVGAPAVELANTLHLGSGPLARLDHCPKADEPVLIALSQVTLRGAGPLLACHYEQIEDRPGEISIQAAGCAFVPGANAALLLFSGPDSPERLLRKMSWTGQGSLVPPEVVVAAWRQPDGRQQVLDDASVSIAGLVRSEVGFAGGVQAGPAASRIIRWQVPLQSTDPPGIDPEALPGRDGMAGGL